MTKHLLGIWCVVTAAACGGGGEIAAKDLPSALEDIRCDYLVACGYSVDSQACHDSLGSLPQLQELLDAVDDGTVIYDGEAAKDCFDKLYDTSCQFAGFTIDTRVCDDVFTGTVAVGGACVIDTQCADHGTCEQTDPNCDRDTMCCPGTCAASTEQESQAGGPCGDDAHTCAFGLYCNQPTQGAGTCAAQISDEGAACTDLFACAGTLYCNLDFSTGMGTCERPAASGAACVPDDLIPCADERDYCAPTTSTCVRRLAPGAACEVSSDCVGYGGCDNGICTADLGPGAACSDTGPDCAGTLECTNGTCQQPAAGPTCSL